MSFDGLQYQKNNVMSILLTLKKKKTDYKIINFSMKSSQHKSTETKEYPIKNISKFTRRPKTPVASGDPLIHSIHLSKIYGRTI